MACYLQRFERVVPGWGMEVFVAFSAADWVATEEIGSVRPFAFESNPVLIPFKDTFAATIKAAVDAGYDVDTTWRVCKVLLKPEHVSEKLSAGELGRAGRSGRRGVFATTEACRSRRDPPSGSQSPTRTSQKRRR